MQPLFILAVVAAVTTVWFFALPWLVGAAKRRQARNVQAGVIGAGLDEVFHPHARRGRIEWDQQVEAPAPAPSPGDKALDGGRIVIQVDEDRHPTS